MALFDEKLQTFITLSETKSFTKTGEVTGLTQPAVTSQIKRLEEELNCTLFLRKKGEMTLSDEGEVALLYAKRLRAVAEKMRDRIRTAKSEIKKFRIGITHTQENGFMIDAMSRLIKENDKLNITLIADDIKNLYTMLENFELDMAVLEGKPANKSFNFTVIDTDMLTLVASKDSVLAKKSTVSLSELKKQNLILRLPNSATREKFASSLEAIGESLDEFNVVIEVDSVSTIKNLVRKNAGVTVMSKSACLKEVNKGSLVSLPIENLSMIRETAIVYDKSFSHPEIVDEIAKSYIDAKNGFYNA